MNRWEKETLNHKKQSLELVSLRGRQKSNFLGIDGGNSQEK
jgi:hypothetical protein